MNLPTEHKVLLAQMLSGNDPEDIIAAVLNQHEANTGLRVLSLEIHQNEVQRVGDPSKEVIRNVRLETEGVQKYRPFS